MIYARQHRKGASYPNARDQSTLSQTTPSLPHPSKMTTVADADEMNETHGHGSAPAPGETFEQHAAHTNYTPVKHWGLGRRAECALFYVFVIPSWCLEISACVIGSYLGTSSGAFIGTVTAWLVLWAAAWLQTATAMIQRASWVRDEANLKDRKQYLYLSVRLQRLMLVRIRSPISATNCLGQKATS